MDQTLSQHFKHFSSEIQQAYDSLMNDPAVGFTIFVIISLIWLMVQYRDFMRSKQQPKPTTPVIKSIEKLSKLRQVSQSTVDEEAVQKERLLKQLQKQAIQNRKKQRENRQKRSKLGSQEFLQKKQILHSFARRPRTSQMNVNLKNIEKQEEESKKNTQEQLPKKIQSKPSLQTELFPKEKEEKKITSFNNINFPSSSSINLDGSSITKKDLVLEKAQPKQELFNIKLPEEKKDKIIQKDVQPKKEQQTTNKPILAGSMFGIAQPSLFSEGITQPKSTPLSTNLSSKPTTPIGPALFSNTSLTPPTDKLFNQANNNIQNISPQTLPNLQNTMKLSQIPKPQQPTVPVPKPVQNKIPTVVNPPRPQPSSAPRPKQKLNSQQLLQAYINFVQNLKQETPITTKIQSLMGGARSSPNVILVQAKSLLATIDKNDDKQITTFALKLFQTIVFNFINNSNVKIGLERIPLRQRTKQCQKNAINAYILTLNMYRLMNHGKKVWAIVFGKILKMMSFLYKRKQDLQNYHKLELIQCNYIKKFKEVHSKYVSRIDFLMYFLLGMTAFDPLLILRQVEAKQRDVQTSRAQIQSWGNKWSYSEFWSLVHAVLNNKHQSYSKPIFFMNLLYVLYPRIYEHKTNPTVFKQENDLFLIVISRAKSYLKGYDKMKEIKILSEIFENDQYEYDGADLVKSIQVLDSRFAEKEIEIKMNPKDFEAKANIFYYFTKQK